MYLANERDRVPRKPAALHLLSAHHVVAVLMKSEDS